MQRFLPEFWGISAFSGEAQSVLRQLGHPIYILAMFMFEWLQHDFRCLFRRAVGLAFPADPRVSNFQCRSACHLLHFFEKASFVLFLVESGMHSEEGVASA